MALKNAVATRFLGLLLPLLELQWPSSTPPPGRNFTLVCFLPVPLSLVVYVTACCSPVFSVSFSGHQHYRVGDLRNIGLGGGSRMLVAWICSPAVWVSALPGSFRDCSSASTAFQCKLLTHVFTHCFSISSVLSFLSILVIPSSFQFRLQLLTSMCFRNFLFFCANFSSKTSQRLISLSCDLFHSLCSSILELTSFSSISSFCLLDLAR